MLKTGAELSKLGARRLEGSGLAARIPLGFR